MKEQIISERANIIANLRQLVQSLVELNMRAKHTCLPIRQTLRN